MDKMATLYQPSSTWIQLLSMSCCLIPQSSARVWVLVLPMLVGVDQAVLSLHGAVSRNPLRNQQRQIGTDIMLVSTAEVLFYSPLLSVESLSAKEAADQLLSASGIPTEDVYVPEDTAGIDYKKGLSLPCARRAVQVGAGTCGRDGQA